MQPVWTILSLVLLALLAGLAAGEDTTPPVAVVGDDVEVDQGAIVTLDGSASTDNVGIANWTWSIPSGTRHVSYFGPRCVHAFLDAGEFRVDLIVTDAAGNVNNDSLYVRVRDTTPPVADADEDMFAEQGLPTTLNGLHSSDNVGISNWTWSFEEGGVPVTLYGPRPAHVFWMPGEHVVTLAISDAAGNRASDSLVVTVHDTTPPQARAGRDVTVDQGEAFTLDGTASIDNVAVVNWTWTVAGTDLVLHGYSITLAIGEAGVHMVTMEVRDNSGNAASDRLNVTVRDITPPIADAGPALTVERGMEVIFNGTNSTDDVGVVSWVWEFDDGHLIGEGEEVYWTFHRSGEFRVRLTVTDAAGNEDTVEVNVTVREWRVEEWPPWWVHLPVLAFSAVCAVVIVVVLQRLSRRHGRP